MKAMNKMILAAFFLVVGFAVNAQEVTSAKQDPVKKTETKPMKFDRKKAMQKKVKQTAPVKKEATPMQKD